jgi:hypothetical protein
MYRWNDARNVTDILCRYSVQTDTAYLLLGIWTIYHKKRVAMAYPVLVMPRMYPSAQWFGSWCFVIRLGPHSTSVHKGKRNQISDGFIFNVNHIESEMFCLLYSPKCTYYAVHNVLLITQPVMFCLLCSQ